MHWIHYAYLYDLFIFHKSVSRLCRMKIYVISYVLIVFLLLRLRRVNENKWEIFLFTWQESAGSSQKFQSKISLTFRRNSKNFPLQIPACNEPGDFEKTLYHFYRCPSTERRISYLIFIDLANCLNNFF